jgi:hypothetical protein
VYIEIINGQPTVIENPLKGDKKVSSIPKISEEVVVKPQLPTIDDASYG